MSRAGRGLAALAWVAASVLGATAQAGEYNTVLPEGSQISFTSRQMGVPVAGRFGKFAATVAFDPAHPEAGRATLEIDLASIDAGSDEANEEVAGKNWFNTKAYPKARFTATRIQSLGGGRFEVTGPLSLKGKTRDITAPFSFKTEGSRGLFEGSLPFKRLDFGIGEGPWGDTDTVANEVQIKFRFAALPGAPKP